MGKYFKTAILPKRVAIAMATMLSMALAACGTDTGQQASESNSTPEAESADVDSAAAPSTINDADTQQAFNNPVVPGKKKPNDGVPLSVAAAPNLIQPTNPTERAVVVDTGRPDPFAQIVSPKFVPPPASDRPSISVGNSGNTNTRNRTARNNSRPVPKVPSLPAVSSRQRSQNASRIRRSEVASARLPASKPPQPATPKVVPSVMPPVVPDPALAATLPPPPQPELARAVAVSGVVMVGNQAQAIIKVPNEPSSRYVQVGDRLANGVLVKRIEMNNGSDPVVVFEQFGIEVAKMVGEGGAATTADAAGGTGLTPPNVPTQAS